MARVPRRATSAQAPRPGSRIAKTRTRKHKIVMESVTQAKKKLRSVISFEANAPPGYTFIPAGNPQLTNACKETCRKDGYRVFAVSTTPHQRMHNLSQQVHRIGYHFPSVVVATKCMELGVFLSTTGKVMSYQGAPFPGAPANYGGRKRADSEVSQTTINTEARDAIKDLFPNIPDKDLNQIIKTAFQKGQRKVGTAAELPLARRVQLAVVAHIRHVYTKYDRLLKITSFQEARAAVEQPTLAKLVQWRGDDENGKTVLEDVFREVIVISDSEEDESDMEQDADVFRADRDSSIEVVSSNALIGDLEMRPVPYPYLETANNNAARDLSGDEAPTGFRFVGATRRRDATRKKNPDRRGFNRYQAWDQARDRYRDGANPADYAHVPRHPLDDFSMSRAIPESPVEPARIRPEYVQGMNDHQVNTAQRGPPMRPIDPRYERPAPLGGVMRQPDPQIRSNAHNSYVSLAVFELILFHDPSPRDSRMRIKSHIEKIPLTLAESTQPQPMNGRQTEPIGAPGRAVLPFPRTELERARPQPPDSTYVPISRNGPPSGNPASQVRSQVHTSKVYRPLDNPEENRERVLPSIETPQSPPNRAGRFGPRDHQTLTNEYTNRHQTPPYRTMEDLSRQVNVIDIDDDRDQILYKRRRVEYNTPLRENFTLENRVHEARPVAAPSQDRPREPQYISLISPQSGRGSDRAQPRFRDENHLPLNNYTPVAGRQLEKHPVGRAPSLIPIHPNPNSPRSSDRDRGHYYGAPISLRHSRHGPDASLNSLIKPQAPISLSRDPGYMVREDGHAVRPNQVSNLVEPRSQFADRGVRQASEAPRVLRDQLFREAGQSSVARQADPGRRHYVSNQGPQTRGEHPHNIVRPVQSREMEAPMQSDMPRLIPRGREPVYIPSNRAERVPYTDQGAYRVLDQPVPGSHMYPYPSAQHPHSNAGVSVSGQHRVVRVGPGPAPQNGNQFMAHPAPSAAPREARGQFSLDNGRYVRQERSLSPRRDDRNERMPPGLHERAYPPRPFPPRDDVILVAD